MERIIQIKAGSALLEGNLTLPAGAHGVVLFAHGSGSSRHSPRNRFVAAELQKAGLATLLMDLLTAEEEKIDLQTRHLRFDLDLLAQRLQAALTLLGKIDTKPEAGPVVVLVMDRNEIAQYQKFVTTLRNAGIRAEMYLGNPKNNLGVQFKYADRRNSPCAIIQGGDEKAQGIVQIKDLILGAQVGGEGADREAFLQKQQSEAQVAVSESELVDAVRKVLARHNINWT